jgi:uncharacterized protein with GYD domain
MLYVLLARITDEGLRRFHANPDLFASACRRVKVDGARLLSRYATLGEYDFVAMAEADDAENMARLSVALGAEGYVHIESMQAVSAHLMAEPTGVVFINEINAA